VESRLQLLLIRKTFPTGSIVGLKISSKLNKKWVASAGFLCVIVVLIGSCHRVETNYPIPVEIQYISSHIPTNNISRFYNIITKVNPKDGAEMVYVPAGEFTMGYDFAEDPDEKPAHKDYLDGYYIYKNDVTWGQYKAFCTASGHPLPPLSQYNANTHDDHPVEYVTWFDANSYATWAGVSLPTEAQWEKAARGTDGRIFPWGNDWDPTKFCTSIGQQRTSDCAINSFPDGASPYGGIDMIGNVSQWCSDWYTPFDYSQSSYRNPEGPTSGIGRVVRGSAYYENIYGVFLPSDRDGADPSGGDVIGFRCVLPSDSP
jgi:formylglycine-generating enzyme required for sulfatase activity